MKIVVSVQNLCSCFFFYMRVFIHRLIPLFLPQARVGHVLSIINITVNYCITIVIFKPLYQLQQSTLPNTFVR